jgi:hypothetical protein
VRAVSKRKNTVAFLLNQLAYTISIQREIPNVIRRVRNETPKKQCALYIRHVSASVSSCNNSGTTKWEAGIAQSV